MNSFFGCCLDGFTPATDYRLRGCPGRSKSFQLSLPTKIATYLVVFAFNMRTTSASLISLQGVALFQGLSLASKALADVLQNMHVEIPKLALHGTLLVIF